MKPPFLLALALFLGPSTGTLHGQRTPVVPETPQAPEATTHGVYVEFQVVTRIERPATSRPDITVAFGVGRKGDPQGHADRPVLARAASDEDGLIRITLPVPNRWKRDESAWVWARVETPGYARRTALRYPRSGANITATRVIAQPGGTVYGRVRSAGGEPVEGARVWVFRSEWDRAEHVGSGSTSSDGRFELHFTAAGEHVVHARSGGTGAHLGSGRSGELHLDPIETPPSLELTLRGGASMTGRVRDPAGQPMPGVRILAVPRAQAGFPDAAACYRAEADGGLFGNLAVTDREGRFELRGLMPECYALYAAWSPIQIGTWTGRLGRYRDGHGTPARALGELLVQVSFVPGSEPVELVFESHRIEVEVVDAEGARPEFLDPDAGYYDQASYLFAEPRTDPGPFRGAIPRPPILVDGLAVLPVEPEREYTVSWTDPRVPLLEEVVTLPRERFRTRLNWRLGERTRPATLTVRVQDPTGQPCEAEPRVWLASAATRRELESSIRVGLPPWNLVHDSAWSVELPPGRILVHANAIPLIGCVVPSPYPRAPFRPAEVEVVLEPGVDRIVDVRLGPAGHLDFESMHGAAGPSEKEKRHFFHPEHEHYLMPELAREPLDGGFVTLGQSDGTRCDELRFEVPGAPIWSIDWVKPGWTARCLTPIPPGRWTLRVVDGGGDDDEVLFEREVVIEANRATLVRW